jgi:hypothetical protein
LRLFSVSPIEDTYRHFDKTEVTEADSQAVLNTLREHDFQDSFKLSEALETVHTEEGDYLDGNDG